MVQLRAGERARPGPAPVAPGSTKERRQLQWERQRKSSRLEGDENTEPKRGPRVRGLEEILSRV